MLHKKLLKLECDFENLLLNAVRYNKVDHNLMVILGLKINDAAMSLGINNTHVTRNSDVNQVSFLLYFLTTSFDA